MGLSSLATLLHMESQVKWIQGRLKVTGINELPFLMPKYIAFVRQFYEENESEVDGNGYERARTDMGFFLSEVSTLIVHWSGVVQELVPGVRIGTGLREVRRHPADGGVQLYRQWMFPVICDYWNWNTNAVYVHSKEIERYDEPVMRNVYASIRFCVETYCRDLPDRQLAMTAFMMSEYLYKSLNKNIFYLSSPLLQYLQASAGTFCGELSRRGFQVHYLIDNTFTPTERGMAGPLDVYKKWFSASGFTYICPQDVALDMMKMDGTEDLYFKELPRYIGSARTVVDRMVERCHREKRHYVLLDTNALPESFQKSMEAEETPGVITLFRNEPPVPGSCARSLCLNGEGRSLFQ